MNYIPVWKQQGQFEVSLKQFSGDFQTIVAQFEAEVSRGKSWEEEMKEGWIAIVYVRLYNDFASWALDMEPDWDRYYWDGVQELVDRGLLPKKVLQRLDYDERIPELKAIGLTYKDVTRIGFERFVDAMANSIADGKNVPPLVTLKGKPVDGRHRTLAALQLGRKTAPVIEITEIR